RHVGCTLSRRASAHSDKESAMSKRFEFSLSHRRFIRIRSFSAAVVASLACAACSRGSSAGDSSSDALASDADVIAAQNRVNELLKSALPDDLPIVGTIAAPSSETMDDGLATNPDTPMYTVYALASNDDGSPREVLVKGAGYLLYGNVA